MKNGCLPAILGKRKGIGHDETLVLRLSPRLATTPLPGHSSSQPSSQQTLKMKNSPIIINGVLVQDTKKRYSCTFEGCGKAYTKPSRLEEHERSHTGQVSSPAVIEIKLLTLLQRPFVCEICGNSYLRDTHLHAHTRCHLPESSRPFICERQKCGKRFWTSQHLKTHYSWHDGAKPYTVNKLLLSCCIHLCD
jgi:general transcription factor IIIA